MQHIKNYIQHTIMEASISLQHFFSDIVTQNLLPMCGYVSAGFPSPAADYIDEQLDLNAYCITNRAATFIVRVSGDSMRDAGIFDTDIAVVDRSLTPKNNDIIIGIIEGEFTIKRLIIRGSDMWLYPENKQFQPIKITEHSEFRVWGVVTRVIHSFGKR